MSGPEGWDGKSVREHVEGAAAEASGARELAEEAHDEIAALSAQIEELRKGALRTCNGDPVASEETLAEMNRTQLFPKVKQVRDEIGRWNHFLTEARGVRAALAQYNALPGPVRDAKP